MSVVTLAEATGERFDSIVAARERTAAGLAERRALLGEVVLDPDATVVLLGSWGRHEVTSASDDDAIVLFCGEKRDFVQPEPGLVARALGGPAPGPEGLFGATAWLGELTDRIGLDGDTNTILTRRMLFLLESVPVAGDAAYARGREDAARHLPHRPRARLPPAALPAQRPRPLLAHDRRRLRGQAPRAGGAGLGPATRQAALQPQGAVRRRPAAGARVPRAARGRHAGLPRRAARASRRWTASPLPSSPTTWPTPAPAPCAPTRSSSTCSTTPARDEHLAGLAEADADAAELYAGSARSATSCRRRCSRCCSRRPSSSGSSATT